MNPWQMSQQLKHLLSTVAWPTGSAETVFGVNGVHVFAGTPTEEQIPPVFPWVMVGIDGGEADQDHPELITQGYTLISAAHVLGDTLGEHALIGGGTSDLGSSKSLGVGEVAERVRSALEDLTGADGAKILVTSVATGTPTPLGRGLHIVLDEHSIEALCTSALHYSAPQVITNNGTTWTWEGGHCSSRFDFLQYRMVSKSGSSPSTDPSDGTVVYTGTAATIAGIPTAATTYTVFADYNARGGTTIDGSSDPVVGAYLVP